MSTLKQTAHEQFFIFYSAKMVGEEHFGGFLTKKQDELGADGKPKSWKERMEEIIAKSKKEKVRKASFNISTLSCICETSVG